MALTAVDSSLLIPAVAPWHLQHDRADQELGQIANLRMIGHVLIETYSWLTRSRPRTPPQVAASLLRALPGPPLVLSSDGHARVLELAARRGLMGGAIHDALIAATALRETPGCYRATPERLGHTKQSGSSSSCSDLC